MTQRPHMAVAVVLVELLEFVRFTVKVAVKAQSESSGPEQRARSHQQIQETCNA